MEEKQIHENIVLAYNKLKKLVPSKEPTIEELLDLFTPGKSAKLPVKKAVSDLTLDETLTLFDLKLDNHYKVQDDGLGGGLLNFWDIAEEVKAVAGLPTNTSKPLDLFVHGYKENFARTSESTCRTAVDLVLNQSLIDLKGISIPTGDDRTAKIQTPYSDIKIYGEVSFKHTTTSGTIVSGRVDFGIGLAQTIDSKKRFRTLMFLMESKTEFDFPKAADQLIAYLGALHQERKRGGRSDTSVYGCSTDGSKFEFINITHNGHVRKSRLFGTEWGDVYTVIAILKHLLQIAANQSPNTTPKKVYRKTDMMAVDSNYDNSVDLDDILHPNVPSNSEDATE